MVLPIFMRLISVMNKFSAFKLVCRISDSNVSTMTHRANFIRRAESRDFAIARFRANCAAKGDVLWITWRQVIRKLAPCPISRAILLVNPCQCEIESRPVTCESITLTQDRSYPINEPNGEESRESVVEVTLDG